MRTNSARRLQSATKRSHSIGFLIVLGASLLILTMASSSIAAAAEPQVRGNSAGTSPVKISPSSEALAPTAPGQVSNGSKMRGVSYRNWWPGAFADPESDLSLAYAERNGSDWVSVIIMGYQDTYRSTKIVSGARTPSDSELAHVIGRAHALGLKVMLKPQLDLLSDPQHLRGDIGRGFTSAGEWGSWFSAYKRYIEHYADIAAVNGAELLCVGAELSGTSGQSQQWQKVISGVRQRYGGQLVYSADHTMPTYTGEEAKISWWNSVDYIGVTAYYPLTEKESPSVQDLAAGWDPWVSLLADLSSTWKKNVLFTEIGYRSVSGANRRPWDSNLKGTVDLDGQAAAYEAAYQRVWSQSWFSGMFWWEWGTLPEQGGAKDDGYTPHGKPAEQVMKSWYGRLP